MIYDNIKMKINDNQEINENIDKRAHYYRALYIKIQREAK